MEKYPYKHIYFLGIGGIGMSGLARYFHSIGIHVTGYDKTSTELTQKLEKEGIKIHYQEDLSALESTIDLVVYTPAIPKENIEWIEIQQRKLSIKKRAEVLGMLSKKYQTIAVAGTHGKTTTTSMIAHLMYQSTLGCQAFVGGVMTNYQSNLLLHPTSSWMVLEADEYDRSFMQLHPKIAVINSVDADHLDIYGSPDEVVRGYQAFASQIQEGGTLICHFAIQKYFPKASYTFSFDQEHADVYAKENTVGQYQIYFKPFQDSITLTPPLPGKHNIENLIAAILACRLAGVSKEQIQQITPSFKGIHRRFERVFEGMNTVLIDDYAHHPSEIEAVIQAARSYYPGRKITVVFQPHLFTRTRDFLNEFAQSLSAADSLYLLDIYPAREKPIAGVNSAVLLTLIKSVHKFLITKDEVIPSLKQEIPSVVLILGAGDIDVLVPQIKQFLMSLEG